MSIVFYYILGIVDKLFLDGVEYNKMKKKKYPKFEDVPPSLLINELRDNLESEQCTSLPPRIRICWIKNSECYLTADQFKYSMMMCNAADKNFIPRAKLTTNQLKQQADMYDKRQEKPIKGE